MACRRAGRHHLVPHRQKPDAKAAPDLQRAMAGGGRGYRLWVACLALLVLAGAGAYAVQEKGEWIVEAVHGSLTNVVGLPVERLGQELIAWFDTASAHP